MYGKNICYWGYYPFSIKINKNVICYNLLHKMEIMISVVMCSAITCMFKGNMIEFTIKEITIYV
jgi:hypothetical protein